MQFQFQPFRVTVSLWQPFCKLHMKNQWNFIRKCMHSPCLEVIKPLNPFQKLDGAPFVMTRHGLCNLQMKTSGISSVSLFGVVRSFGWWLVRESWTSQLQRWKIQAGNPVRLAYKSYYFSQRTVFFSHNKSANSTFSHDLSAKRTGQFLMRSLL